MLYTVIKSNSYQDSVSLMLLTNKLSGMEGINRISIMMGTPANKDIFKNTGLLTPEVERANPNDICIVIDTDHEELIARAVGEVDSFLQNQALKTQGANFSTVRTWESALRTLPEANLALISIPGHYAAKEAEKAVEKGMNVFIFSDNISLEEEYRLKQKAREKGVLLMGPDCGTGIVSGIPLAFANVIKSGNIGIVGASGTGIQEVATIIDRLGSGVSHAIGTGGRDLSERIGASAAIEALKGLAADGKTEVIVLISKPPAAKVRDKVISFLKMLGKPAVAVFIGEIPKQNHDNIVYAWTLEDAARKAVELSSCMVNESPVSESIEPVAGLESLKTNQVQRFIKGLYSGGTLGAEAAMLIRNGLGGIDESEHKDGVLLKIDGHEIIDLGDDVYTQGRPHPMIDPRLRNEMILQAAKDPGVAVILLDVVLGYGSHEDMAGSLASAITKANTIAEEEGRKLIFIASVCGTAGDPQIYEEQAAKLEHAGVIVKESNASAARLAAAVAKHLNNGAVSSVEEADAADFVKNLLKTKPIVINIGLRHFADTIQRYGGQVVQYDWAPAAGGNQKLAGLLAKLK
ncbi:acyl-CoA synthetase FdrA [Fodinisporobacter ferrooxydans]|uniref:Acyl-CoA synthetase FdrA n=1 Tax=Fodinisporobacter ferrooxydans TaxID=2901836 RepID=A0ABY4CPD9_9BACL|nr:acyl-CoA synthetase FdrA [Alicyclobacillaceae bacterium MYW30-H2]